MYEPPLNREERPEVLHGLISSQPLGLLISHGAGTLTANPVPFVLHADVHVAALNGGGPQGTGSQNTVLLECHLSRANEQWREFVSGGACLVVFQGPQAYVTPSWYPAKREHGKVVPTWNYIMVQARGTAHVVDDPAWLRRHLDELTDRSEASLAEPWKVSDAPESYLGSMLKGIVGLRIAVTSLTGKWKLSQNRSRADRAGVIAGLEEQGGEAGAVAATMRDTLAERTEPG